MPRTKTHKQIAEEKRDLRYSLEAVYGMDNLPVGTIIKFFKIFEEGGDEFTYVALKVREDSWFFGGSYFAWTDLLFELDYDNLYVHDPSLIQVATEFKALEVTPPF